MPRLASRKCLNCQQFFIPHPRSKGRQTFCSCPDCQKASKQVSQRKWLSKPENQDYFCGPDNVRRVQCWRAKHPGYSRRAKLRPDNRSALQDSLMPQTVDLTEENRVLKVNPLQDVLMAQPIVLIGLIAHLTGATLQEDIVATGLRLRQLGEDFLNSPKPEGAHDAQPTLTQPQSPTPNAQSIQLGRSPPGA